MERTRWTDRKFTFDYPEGWLANILERLRGTHPRMMSITTGVSEAELMFKPDGKWSIKEHIGHLGDLEELHTGRLDDFAQRKKTLRSADMSNAKTEGAHHNSRSLDDLLEDFKSKRDALLRQFETMDDETQMVKAVHPRLNIPMRPVDVGFFTAEHDDHHLAGIREIINRVL
jgi:hypothetical protein